MGCQQRRDGYIRKSLPLFCFVLSSPPLNSGLYLHLLLAPGHFSSSSDPFSMSLISGLVSEHLVSVCQIQKEDINSSCFGTLTLFSICPCYHFFALSFSPHYLLFSLTPQPLTSRLLHFCFSPPSHRSFLQRVAQSRLSDTEMMQKDKTI